MPQRIEITLYDGRTIPMQQLDRQFPVEAHQLPLADLIAKGVPLQNKKRVWVIGVSRPRLNVVVFSCSANGNGGANFTVVSDRVRLLPQHQKRVADALQSLEEVD